MPLVDLKELLQHAGRNGYAVCAFDLTSLDFLTAAVEAAENIRAPVILSVSEPHLKHIDGELLAPAIEAAARRARVPVAIQFARARSTKMLVHGIRLGFNGVAIDATRAQSKDYTELRTMTQTAQACGVQVEGGLNVILRYSNGSGISDAVTVEEAREFVEHSGVDFLAITEAPTGNVQPRISFARLAQLQSCVGVPLTIDGNHAFSDDDYSLLVKGGVVKINHSVGLSRAAAECMRQNIKSTHRNSYLKLMRGVHTAIRSHAEHCLRLSGSAGRADHAAVQCRQWREVTHFILYNASDGARECEVQGMMASGRKTLAAIPGVREVFTGRAVHENTRYRYCWRVRFAHPAVIASYRDHPDHVAFADGRFRPIAADRISIDLEEVT